MGRFRGVLSTPGSGMLTWQGDLTVQTLHISDALTWMIWRPCGLVESGFDFLPDTDLQKRPIMETVMSPDWTAA